jgi:hypothetical protein
VRGVGPIIVLDYPVLVLGALWRSYHVVIGGSEVHWLVYSDSPGFHVPHSMNLLRKSLYMLLFW